MTKPAVLAKIDEALAQHRAGGQVTATHPKTGEVLEVGEDKELGFLSSRRRSLGRFTGSATNPIHRRALSTRSLIWSGPTYLGTT